MVLAQPISCLPGLGCGLFLEVVFAMCLCEYFGGGFFIVFCAFVILFCDFFVFRFVAACHPHTTCKGPVVAVRIVLFDVCLSLMIAYRSLQRYECPYFCSACCCASTCAGSVWSAHTKVRVGGLHLERLPKRRSTPGK